MCTDHLHTIVSYHTRDHCTDQVVVAHLDDTLALDALPPIHGTRSAA